MPRNLGFSDGSSMSIDRTREAGVRTLGFSDGTSKVANRTASVQTDPAGESRPLLSKLVGGASAAYSLRDLNDKQGENKVVNVRRSLDNSEKIFKAKDVPTIKDWVSGKQDTTLPASEDEAQAIRIVGGNQVADVYVSTSLTNGKPVYFSTTLSTQLKLVFTSSNPRWLLQNASTSQAFVVSTSTGEDEAFPTKIQDLSTYFSGTGTKEITSITPASPAAAAYSLRKVKSAYTGNAVRIRRSSDNIEVDVAFDSEGKVSARSSITNVAEQGGESGSTTATDLNGLLNDEHTIDFEASSFSRVRFNRTDDQTIAGQIADKFEVNTTGSNYYLYNTSFFDTNASGTSLGTSQSKQVLTFKYYVDSTESPNVNYLHLKTGSAGNSAPFNELTVINVVKDSWQTVTLTVNSGNTASGLRFYILVSNIDNSSNASTMTVGEAIYLQDIPITYSEVTAFVHTWYDQAGANNAVQATASRQPKIAENGALLADGLDFDGSDDFLESNTLSSIYTGTDEAHSSFVVVNSDAATTTQYILGIGSTSSSNTLRNILFHSGGNIGWQVRDDDGAYKNDLSANSYVANQTYLVSALNSGTTIDFNTNSVINDNGTDADVGASTINTVKIGALAVNSSSPLNGSIKEAIFYASDQSANRFKIESNINNYYGLYNDELELNGEALPASSVIIGGVTYSSGTLVTLPNKNSLEYTLNDTLTSNRFMRYMVNPNGNLTNLSNGDKVYVSFNLTAPDGLSIIAQLRDNFTGVSSTASFSGSGFKSFSLTRNSTAGTIDNIMFQSSGVGNATISMTDIKISAVARNGFVETWHDQSGHDRHASQTEEQAQPYIVINGGSVKTAKGFYAIDQDGRKAGSGVNQKAGLRTEYNPTGTDGALTEYSLFALYEQTSNDGNNINGILFSSGGASGNAGYGGIVLKNLTGGSGRLTLNNTDGNNTGGGSSSSTTSIVAATTNDGNAYGSVIGIHLISGHFKHGVGMITREDGVTSADEELNAPIPHASNNANQGKVMLLAEYTYQQTNPWNARASEIIFYEKDHRLNTEAIEANINNQYQIYS